MSLVYVSIGSNLEFPMTQARQAVEALKQLPDSQLLECSSLYASSPMGPQDQPDYVNAVVLLETSLEPLTLLDHTQAIELNQGRQRKEERWGARTLDLDILLYDQQAINSERLTIPHYGMKQREFVLYPLFEIAPDLILPDGDKISDLLHKIDRNDITVIGSI